MLSASLRWCMRRFFRRFCGLWRASVWRPGSGELGGLHGSKVPAQAPTPLRLPLRLGYAMVNGPRCTQGVLEHKGSEKVCMMAVAWIVRKSRQKSATSWLNGKRRCLPMGCTSCFIGEYYDPGGIPPWDPRYPKITGSWVSSLHT